MESDEQIFYYGNSTSLDITSFSKIMENSTEETNQTQIHSKIASETKIQLYLVMIPVSFYIHLFICCIC